MSEEKITANITSTPKPEIVQKIEDLGSDSESIAEESNGGANAIMIEAVKQSLMNGGAMEEDLALKIAKTLIGDNDFNNVMKDQVKAMNEIEQGEVLTEGGI